VTDPAKACLESKEFEKMSRTSAGILVYKKTQAGPEVLLVHPGGPFWSAKDLNSWSVPKGEIDEGEDPFEAAKREFGEETGLLIDGDFVSLETVKQSSGKSVICWAVEGEIDVSKVKSNLFKMEWPPKSGAMKEFPEIDRAEWFPAETAKLKIVKGQIPIIENLERILKTRE
jgi:predicted NUDIX family NTP pyrophosphohydrolase